jgi:hypothetical protein
MDFFDPIVLAAARQQRRSALHQIDVFFGRSELHLVAERMIHTRRRGYLVRSDPVSRPITRSEFAHWTERRDLFGPRGLPRDTIVRWAERFDTRRDTGKGSRTRTSLFPCAHRRTLHPDFSSSVPASPSEFRQTSRVKSHFDAHRAM